MTLRLYNLLLDFNGLLVAYRFVIGITWDPGGGKYEMGRKNGNWKGGQMNESSNFAFFHTCGNLVEAFNLSQIIDRQRKQFIGMARQKRESRWDQALTSISCHQVTTKKPEKW